MNTYLKHIKTTTVCLFYIGTMVLTAQNSLKNENGGPFTDGESATAINRARENNTAPIFIEVAFDKAVHISFDKKITYCDVGTKEIIYKKVNNGKDLKIVTSSEKPGFKESNITVVSGGYYYFFKVKYNNNPKKEMHYISIDDAAGKSGGEKMEESPAPKQQNIQIKNSFNKNRSKKDNESIAATCQKIANNNTAYLNHNDVNGRVELSLLNVYINDNKLFFHIRFDNNSNISYDIDMLRFGVENRKKSKIKVVQDRKVPPIYIYNTQTHIPGMMKSFTKIYVFDKFTIDKKNKILLVESWEKDGDRNLRLKLNSDVILDAKLIK
jgi:conjugative transposon TraN protein